MRFGSCVGCSCCLWVRVYMNCLLGSPGRAADEAITFHIALLPGCNILEVQEFLLVAVWCCVLSGVLLSSSFVRCRWSKLEYLPSVKLTAHIQSRHLTLCLCTCGIPVPWAIRS